MYARCGKNKLKKNKIVKVLGNIDVDLDVFYKKTDIPTLSLGDTVKVTIFLELPKKVEEGEKKEKERIQAYEGIII